jgi:predicted CoA-binding protein
VHPKRKSVWGLPAFAGLAEVSVPVDLVDVFRAPEYCAEHAREALKLSPPPRLFWMQLGITNAEAVSLLAEQGIPVVEDACLMVEHARIFGMPCID